MSILLLTRFCNKLDSLLFLRRNADFFTRKFEMDKKVEDMMSDLSSDEDVKKRKKEGREKAQGRIKNSECSISCSLSEFFVIIMSRQKFGKLAIKFFTDVCAHSPWPRTSRPHFHGPIRRRVSKADKTKLVEFC